jgi:hypothetical protein
MTVEREEPHLLVAVCDGCGERRILDVEAAPDEDLPTAEIAAALDDIGWQQGKPDTHRFGHAQGFGDRYRETYAHDLCGICQTDEPAPHPLVRPRPPRPRCQRDAFANDPCDEWPRDLVFAAVGLRPDCGHPPTGTLSSCGFCERGFPIGSTTPGWMR